MQKVSEGTDRDTDTVKKQLLINISEMLNEKGLISNDEKNRMKVIVSNNKK